MDGVTDGRWSRSSAAPVSRSAPPPATRLAIRACAEAEPLEQAARIDAVSQNEFVRQAVLDRIAARKG